MAKNTKVLEKKIKNSDFTPVVAVMGHVDHGKTSLLDKIRSARVAATEAGGITQNTRAHQIRHQSRAITFIDTPGHEAFSSMRARGAAVTDIVLLVVAADDGLQPQTKESIQFAKDSNTPIIVALNKTDLPGVNITKIKQELSSFGVVIEEYGGDTLCYEVSALTGQGIPALLDGIDLFVEVSELQHQPPEYGAIAQAFILESTTHKQLGTVALAILQRGKLDHPYPLLSLGGKSRIRNFLDADQKVITTVGTHDPFWITGLKHPLQTGETVYFAADELDLDKIANQVQLANPAVNEDPVEFDANKLLLQRLSEAASKKAGTEQKVLNIIVKSSSQGTLEVVKSELNKLSNPQRKINLLEASTGEVTENDVRRAKLAGGIVISFQRTPSAQVERLANQERVIVRNYEVIYEMLEELEVVLESLITPDLEEVEISRARVKQLFTLSDGTVVCGCEVSKGIILKGYRVFIDRVSAKSSEDEVAEIGRSKIGSLRILKQEVREAKKGQECGIILEPQIPGIAVGDEIVAYKVDKA